MKKINNTTPIIFAIAVLLILIDIVTSCKSDEIFRMFINYIAVPVTAIFALLKKHKSYWILFTYELIISLLILNDIFGVSLITYFCFPDTWQLLNTLTITPSIFGFPNFLQPIIIFIVVSFFVLVAKCVLTAKFRAKK